MSERSTAFLWRIRWALVALLAPIAIALAVFASGIGVDNAVDIWFVRGDPALDSYHTFQETFGNDEIVVLAIHEEGGIFTPAGLRRLDALSRVTAETDGIVEVTSLTTLAHIRVEEGWTPEFEGEAPPLAVGPVVDALPSTDAEAGKLRLRVMEDPLLRSRLVSSDGEMTLVLARMGSFEGMDARRDLILADLERRIAEVDEGVAEAGIGVIFSALNRASSRDAGVMGGASYALIFALLWILFRKMGPVLLTLGVVGLSSVIALGIYAAAGRDLNMVTMGLPTLVLIIAVSDCVHVLHRVAAQPEGEQVQRVRAGVAEVLLPCLFTSISASAGLIGLATARMQVIRDLGWFAAAGVMTAFAVSVILLLPLLQWRIFEPRAQAADWLRDLVVRMGLWSMARWPAVLVGCLLAVLASAWGISRLEVDTYSIDYFYASHPVRQDSAFIEERFGPYTPLEFWVEIPGGGRTAAGLAAVARWQDAMEADAEVGWTRSVADVTRRLNQVLTDGSEVSYTVPRDDAALEQALFLYESDPDARLDDLVDNGWTRLRVTAGLEMLSARRIGEAIDRLVALAELPEGSRIVPSGYLPLYVTMMDYVVQSQISSFAVSFVLVFVPLAFLFRSIKMAALAVPPNLLPVFLTLGTMGAAGVRLDVATVTIAAIVLGLVVDDSTHYLYRFREEMAAHGDHERAVRETLASSGVAMVTTSLVLVLGFSVFGLATVKSVAFFGLLSALAMAYAMFGDLLMMPALIAATRIRP